MRQVLGVLLEAYQELANSLGDANLAATVMLSVGKADQQRVLGNDFLIANIQKAEAQIGI